MGFFSKSGMAYVYNDSRGLTFPPTPLLESVIQEVQGNLSEEETVERSTIAMADTHRVCNYYERFSNDDSPCHREQVKEAKQHDVNQACCFIKGSSKSEIAKGYMYQFFHNITYHPCIGNALSLSHTGRVHPCPMMRTHVLGDGWDRALYAILERGKEELDKFWNLTLDSREKCGYCEFRYACDDWGALEEKLTGKLEGKRLCV